MLEIEAHRQILRSDFKKHSRICWIPIVRPNADGHLSLEQPNGCIGWNSHFKSLRFIAFQAVSVTHNLPSVETRLENPYAIVKFSQP